MKISVQYILKEVRESVNIWKEVYFRKRATVCENEVRYVKHWLGHQRPSSQITTQRLIIY